MFCRVVWCGVYYMYKRKSILNNITNLSCNCYVIFIDHERFCGVIVLLS